MENKSTHFIFDGEKIVISPDLIPLANFLQEIEKEVQAFLGIENRFVSIRKQYKETLDLVRLLAEKLRENSIDFNFTLSEHPSTIASKLAIYRPIRSEMIVLFANLETLFCLNIAYENKTSDANFIREQATKEKMWKAFYNNFCLTQENEWSKQNSERLKHITAHDLRKLRNSLTHFFSVGEGLAIAHSVLDEKSRKLEQATHFQAKFISSEDLYEIIKGAGILMIKRWNDDCADGLNKNSNEFKEKILSVNKVIEDHGVIIVKNNQINI